VATTVSISGSGQVDITVFGRGTVIAGNGNDSIDITGSGKIIVGSGNDTLTLGSGGVIYEHGASGHDTINIGSGNATIYEQGYATITGAFGSATISGGGGFEINQTGGSAQTTSSGSTGQSHSTVSGSSGTGHESVISGSGHESVSVVGDHHPRQGGMERNLFATLANQIGGAHIKSFVSGIPVLHLEGHTLTYLQPHNDVVTHGGSTYINIAGGKTSIELQGVTTLKASDFIGKH
jgi:hypothetical protein